MEVQKPNNNMALILALLGGVIAILLLVNVLNSRNIAKALSAEMSEQSLMLKTEVLADLESGDPARIEALKARLRSGIGIESHRSYNMRTTPKAQPRKQPQPVAELPKEQ